MRKGIAELVLHSIGTLGVVLLANGEILVAL
jgi:hypothetical protein